jgi:hypothetical protein
LGTWAFVVLGHDHEIQYIQGAARDTVLKEHRSDTSHARISRTTGYQRTHKRVKVNMRLAYRDNDYADRMGRVCNISKGGMYVDTGNCPNVDGLVIASLNVEEFGKVIWIRAQVVRKTDSGMAIALIQKDDKGLNNLLSYLFTDMRLFI